jgi:lysophospholipase L1-like esterase
LIDPGGVDLRVVRHLALVGYCLAIYAALDLAYSAYLHDEGTTPRIFDPVYHHTLVANYDGYNNWGDTRFKVYTNSLGFRDAAVREVPARSSMHRVLLMGDSFTEGLGVNFEDSFAGMLYGAGMRQASKIEFLDAGVIAYSPVLYYQKTKSYLDRGLRFDEVIVFSDPSEVRDEASEYFCSDDDPSYSKYCTDNSPFYFQRNDLGSTFARHFVVTDSIRTIIKFRIQQATGNQKRRNLAPSPETGWLFPEWKDETDYKPLGIEGGVARAMQNMQKLADLLKQNDIPMTIVVYPWPALLAAYNPENRQVTMWRDFCARNNCKKFINLFPAFRAEQEAHADWYERLFIPGDFHYSAEGHRVMFRELAKELL